MRRRPQLFDAEQAPRRKPRVMMHVVDAGEGFDRPLVELQCRRCGHNTGWVPMRTVSEDRRGRPCPKCNQPEGA